MSLYRRLAVVLLAGVITACGGSGGLIISRDDVIPLAKVKRWRAEFAEDLNFPAPVLEIAFDRAAAHRAWEENVPDDIEPREGRPAEPGMYGELADVNFETHALVVWMSGESGTCPEWLAEISRRGDDQVDIRTHSEGTECTDDYNPYRMALAVERRVLPDASELPTEGTVQGSPGVLVVEYPFRDGRT